MGGNAIKNSIRMSFNEYNDIKSKLSVFLNSISIKHITPYEIPNKDSFGDIDILYIPSDYEFIKKTLDFSFIDFENKIIYTNEIVKNGDVISINLFNHQIDFIKTTNECFDVAHNYLSFGDLGKIFGYIFSYYNLKYGQDGLWTYVYDNIDDKTSARQKIFLSKDPIEIYDFLGLKLRTDFLTLEDIFNYIIESKLFNKKIFNFLNYAHRKRNEKRVMYNKFIEYIKNIKDIDEITINKKNIWELALIKFNKFLEMENILLEIEKNRIRKEKYNGKLFLKYVENEKEIGNKKKDFEKYIFDTKKMDLNFYIDNYSDNIQSDLDFFFK